MFGKPDWFRLKTVGWGLRPVTWRGWAYAAAWIGVIAAPFVLLLARHQAPEALVWLTATLGTLGWDVHGIRKEIRGENGRGLLYIGDDGSCETRAARRRHA
jgi:hypothetical protein